MTERIKYISSNEFADEVLKAEIAVVDFYSTECPPCEALASKFDSLSEMYADDIKFIKIHRQENRELAVSLGVSSSPTLLFYKEGQLVGNRLTGGIKRSDIVANLELLIDPKRAGEIKGRIESKSTECDVLIIGGGPSGLAAAIYTAQAKLKTIVVDRDLPGGQVKITHLVSNYPGFSEPISGYMLMHHMSEQAKAAGAEFRLAIDITETDLENKFIVVDGYETIYAKKIIIATGSSPRTLNVKGELEYRGQGISYCATCDAKFYEGKHVVVIGGGNSAIEESLFIAKFASKITIVHQFDKLQANKLAQEKAFAEPKIEFVFEHEPREFIKKGSTVNEVLVEDLNTHELKTIGCDGVFIFAGMIPNINEIKHLFELDTWGYIKTDKDMKTNLDDVYAIGDVVSKSFRQITTAVSDGTVAAISISKELEREDSPMELINS
ncbi:MAG: FAD-dependent oxidoreductase [Ignavibacteriaceae bacterium]|nr:FAD-dependent oxidoreductase [Ignavibacteriaceae bacterium]